MDKALNHTPESLRSPEVQGTSTRYVSAERESRAGWNDGFEKYFESLLQQQLASIIINGKSLRSWAAHIPIKVDWQLLAMPGTGGYFNPRTGEIGINPLALHQGNISMIATIITHEFMHAGVFTGRAIVNDEPLCQLLTIRTLRQSGIEAVTTHYDPLVLELDRAIQGMSDERLMEIARQASAIEQLQQWVIEIALQDSLRALDFTRLTQARLEKEIELKWHLIMSLFPRLANITQGGGNAVSPFEAARLDIRNVLTEKFWLKVGQQVCGLGMHRLLHEQLVQQEMQKNPEITPEAAKVLAAKRLHDEYYYIYSAMENRLESPERVIMEFAG